MFIDFLFGWPQKISRFRGYYPAASLPKGTIKLYQFFSDWPWKTPFCCLSPNYNSQLGSVLGWICKDLTVWKARRWVPRLMFLILPCKALQLYASISISIKYGYYKLDLLAWHNVSECSSRIRMMPSLWLTWAMWYTNTACGGGNCPGCIPSMVSHYLAWIFKHLSRLLCNNNKPLTFT